MLNELGGTGTIHTMYAARIRLYPDAVYPSSTTEAIKPSLICVNNNDLYTYSKARTGQGNHSLENPVGLITADEVSYGGIVYGGPNKMTNNYLYTGQIYWTITPVFFPDADVFAVRDNGCLLGGGWVYSMDGVRPVINLRSDVQFTGNGMQYNPFKVV